MMGQPILGNNDNLQNINAGLVKNNHAAKYTGDKIVIVDTGAVDHETFVDEVNGAFGSIAKNAEGIRSNSDKCVYTPALLFLRDDQMCNVNFGVSSTMP